jgi:hypothetical protein
MVVEKCEYCGRFGARRLVLPDSIWRRHTFYLCRKCENAANRDIAQQTEKEPERAAYYWSNTHHRLPGSEIIGR